jgi:hypothetical protein
VICFNRFFGKKGVVSTPRKLKRRIEKNKERERGGPAAETNSFLKN